MLSLSKRLTIENGARLTSKRARLIQVAERPHMTYRQPTFIARRSRARTRDCRARCPAGSSRHTRHPDRRSWSDCPWGPGRPAHADGARHRFDLRSGGRCRNHAAGRRRAHHHQRAWDRADSCAGRRPGAIRVSRFAEGPLQPHRDQARLRRWGVRPDASGRSDARARSRREREGLERRHLAVEIRGGRRHGGRRARRAVGEHDRSRPQARDRRRAVAADARRAGFHRRSRRLPHRHARTR